MDNNYDRDLIVVSDGTGITAETFAQSLLAQFDITTKTHRIPFVDNMDKAYTALQKISDLSKRRSQPPLIFTTLVDQELSEFVKTNAKGFLIDLFDTFIGPAGN